MGIRLKFNLVMIAIFTLGFVGAGVVSYRLLQDNARDEIVHAAGFLMDTAIAIRGYTVDQVKPHLVDKLETQFLPQTVPAFAATETVNALRKKYPEYSYKEATVNPTNPRNKAVTWETQLVYKFRQNEGIEEVIGERGNVLYIARPIKIKKEGCLACHSSADNAPPSLVELYGDRNGFGWELNDVVGAQIVTVPTIVPIENANQAFMTFMGSLLVVFLSLAVVLNLMLNRIIVAPIRRISRIADEISTGNFDIAEFDESGKDEMAKLSMSFNRMRRSIQTAMSMAAA
jgi:HAMP domain-containing protein